MTALDIVAKWSGLAGRSGGLWAELKSNRRAALGAIGIGILLAGYGLVFLRGATADLRQAYARDTLRLKRIEAIAAQRAWPQHAAASAQARQALENRLWSSSSDGLARAAVEEWVTMAGNASGLQQVQISIGSESAKDIPDLRRISATLTAQAPEAGLIEFLGRVQRAPHLLAIRKLHVGRGPDLFLDAVLVAYVRVGAAAGSAAK